MIANAVCFYAGVLVGSSGILVLQGLNRAAKLPAPRPRRDPSNWGSE